LDFYGREKSGFDSDEIRMQREGFRIGTSGELLFTVRADSEFYRQPHVSDKDGIELANGNP
jgi:hypothetical protein